MMTNTEFIHSLHNILENYPRDHSVNSLRNAFALFSKAKKFSDIDSNICVFLTITAEEEAVSSIFLALKKLGYDASEKINHYNHLHKAAFYHFCQALAQTFNIFEKNSPQIILDSEAELPRLYIKFLIENFDGKPLVVKPDVPFGFTIKNEASIEYFEKNLQRYFGENYEKLVNWLKREANRRNQVLYASPKGIPVIEFNDKEKYFSDYENKLNTILYLYFLIAPYKKKQLFIQQALHAFVRMLNIVPDEEKLMKMIEEKGEAPIGYNFDLNEGKMKGIRINNSAIEAVEFTNNTVSFKVKNN